MFSLDVNDHVNVNTKTAVEHLVSSLLTLNLRRHILSSIICLHSHSVHRKLSQGEHARFKKKKNLKVCLKTLRQFLNIDNSEPNCFKNV